MAIYAKNCHTRHRGGPAIMATMNISLPDKLKSFVDGRVERDGYGTASEYIRELIRHDQERNAQEVSDRSPIEKLRAELQAGLDDLKSGRYRDYESAEALINDIKATGKARLATKRGNNGK
jgi:putative addiction module CopG family antidote